MIDISKISNEKIELYEEKGKYFLRMDFDYEDFYAYYKGHIERIEFDFNLNHIKQNFAFGGLSRIVNIDLGLKSELSVLQDSNGKYFTLTVVKEKVREMTLEDIEKKLGYKVKIVTKSN